MKKLPKIEDCKPGIKPSEYNVLVAPEDTEELTAGGIILPASTKETNDIATVFGRLVAISPHAFTYASSWPENTIPKVGDAVVFAKYAGNLILGADGREYRLCKDKDIAAVMEV